MATTRTGYHKLKDIFAKIILLGDSKVGKTSLSNRFLGKGFQSRYMPTIGVHLTLKKIKTSNFDITLQIWDLAGHPSFQDVRKIYFQGSNVAIVVFDITDHQTLYNIKEWISSLHNCPKCSNIPLIIVGNKKDLRQNKDSEVSPEEGQSFIKNLQKQLEINVPIYFIETSAKTGENIDMVFEKVGIEIYNHFKHSKAI